MALRISTGLSNARLDGDDFKALMEGGFLDIFTGTQPASADYVETGTKLCRISSTSGTAASDGLKFGTAGATAGVLPIGTPVWSGLVLADGVAGWFRFYGTAGTSGSSATEKRFDGLCGVGAGELRLSHTDLVKDTTLTIKTANVTEPAE